MPPEECQADPSNLAKFDWKGLDDLKPSGVTTNTDMAADWKLIGVGGGVKQAKHFCTLCPLQPDDVHRNIMKCCVRDFARAKQMSGTAITIKSYAVK